MAGDSVAKANKPQLRGLLNSSIKKNLIVSIVLAGVSAVAVQVFLKDARRAKYAEFYKTYDPEVAFERMRKRGVMGSASP